MAEIVVIVESTADFRTATKLAERVIIENVDWIDEGIFEHCVIWRGLLPENDPDSCGSCWKNLNQIVRQLEEDGIALPKPRRVRGRSDGAAARKVLRIIQALQNHDRLTVDGILLIRDSDGDTERIKTLKIVRDQFAETHTIAIGMANPNREAWVLNGFVPSDDQERSRLQEVIGKNKFNPMIEAHRLQETTKEGDARWRNPKIVLDHLTNELFERERCCWEESKLSLLRERGQETGLADYLGEVAERLVPIIQRTYI